MSAMSHEFDLPSPAPAEGLSACHSALPAKWRAVHEMAHTVGSLAQLGREPACAMVDDLPQRAAALSDGRRNLIARAIDDIEAVMSPGVRALLASESKNTGALDAALSLWREFHRARNAVLALAPAE